MGYPSITVLTATRNALPDLEKTVRSVAAQTTSLEHVIIDGASSDGSREFLRSLTSDVKWLSEPDTGIADALNKGLLLAKGEYILVLQAGDTFLNDHSALSASRRLMSRRDIISFDVLVTGKKDRVFRSGGFGPSLELFNIIGHQGAFCRRDLFRRIGPFSPDFAVALDYDFFLRAKRGGASIEVIHEVMTIMPDDGISSRLDWKTMRRRLEENKKVQERHHANWFLSAVHNVFWLVYPNFKKLKHQWLDKVSS